MNNNKKFRVSLSNENDFQKRTKEWDSDYFQKSTGK